ncbi:hypothetical protein [uncultured Mucilaginibacter sp.]|uniref:hypothetical protein n=1 Tax=uncultured Mucilaginibacter sp. TaxID=797541 RepID=UPI0025F18680|nr:hypothetical protein [uncultured Mucilaginibacter sp.]
MDLQSKLDNLYAKAKANIWLQYFSVFNRVTLAAGFILAGWPKITGERFTNLHNNQPMGHYLEALFHTGYYYTFIGILQILAGILLLIPRTVVLGALLYLPIILNIFILSLSVRFEGSLLSAPLMILANLYLLCWNYDKLKFILPFKTLTPLVAQLAVDKRFPFKFFAGCFALIVAVLFTITHSFSIMPRNTLKDCKSQCYRRESPKGCMVFCECIHEKGQSLNKALANYRKAVQAEKR